MGASGVLFTPGSASERPRGETPQWMAALEAAYDRLWRAASVLQREATPGGAVDLRPAARALERAFAGIFDAMDGRAHPLDAVRSALAASDEAAATLAASASSQPAAAAALECVREARAAIADADERIAPSVVRQRAPAEELRASDDVPRLHRVDRASLVPALRVPEPAAAEQRAPVPRAPVRPTTFEGLTAAVAELKARFDAVPRTRPAPTREPLPEPSSDGGDADLAAGERRGFAPEIRPATAPSAWLRARVRDCFEQVVLVGTQRAPLPGESWRSSLALERRMFAAIDAVAAIGPRALALLEDVAIDAPAPDASRVFGAAMIFGCVDGRDTLAAAARVLSAFESGDPRSCEEFAGALKLVPHPCLPSSMRAWLDDADPARRAIAVDVLGYRRLASTSELARAAADDAMVASKALPRYALTGDRGVRPAIDAALASDDVALRLSAWKGMAWAADRRAATVLRAELDGAYATEAAVPLATCGDRADADALLERALARPHAAWITAVGWAGAASAVAPLIDLLRRCRGDTELAASIADALERITGAGLLERTTVPAERIAAGDVPDPQVPGPLAPQSPSTARPDAQRPLAVVVGGADGLPSDGAPEVLDRPSVDPARWSAYWRDAAPRYAAGARLRRGWPFTPDVCLRELAHGRCAPAERRLIHRELAFRTAAWLHFDPHDFVVEQESSLREWAPIAARTSAEPGTFGAARPRTP